MSRIAAVRTLGSFLRRWVTPWRFEPRIVRRVVIECPHGRGLAKANLLMDRAGKPEAVLRCSAHESYPPTCDQACRQCAEAVLAPAHAVIVCPPDRPFEEID